MQKNCSNSYKNDVSIIIVHTYEKDLICQTLDSIYRAAPRLNYEIIIVDNNPNAGMGDVLKISHQQITHIPLEKNIGFGAAMNVGIRNSQGKYVLIFNPDIVVLPGSMESLFDFMENNSQVGMCGPQLRNPDGSLQYSCYRFPNPMTPAYRRTILGKFRNGKQNVSEYLMMDCSHDEQMEVDSLIGAAIFARRDALEGVGLFDERFFMYYEDNDLCRRFWENGYEVVYYPLSMMIHYHRRASADGGFFNQLFNRFAWIQIISAIKFFNKYRGKENPRLRRKHE
jgi:GT2 family glycosyltransferase